YRLSILDINAETLKRIGDSRISAIAGDGCRLPFKDNAFDVVTSVDSLEHVPGSRKADYCCELKRVAKRYVIIHCPADSSDGKFQGMAYDTKFLQWYRQFFKKDELNTLEHLKSGLPRVEELISIFQDATVMGKQNGEVWLRCMRWAWTPYLKFITGLCYKLHWRKRDNTPPYHACLLVWRKE
ncbi:class I SAM-dependent methyltransferase, partial [Dehalococcoidia bacterium]|nr:class I SAM-dependent methyltransferase [Dehalococcoidia bacterium]